MSDPITFPPYGRMVTEWEHAILPPKRGPKPSGWRDRVDFQPWRESVADLISHILWPRWLNGGWSGRASGWMKELTLADFELFVALRPEMLKDETLPSAAIVPQIRLFQTEDDSDVKDPVTGSIVADRSIDATLRLYLAGMLNPITLDSVAVDYPAAMSKMVGNVGLELKQDIQRPRPYQTAVLLNRTEFNHNHARSAVTPSMISGHCIQGVMASVAARYRLDAAGLGNDVEVVQAIARHGVDMGDRRVFAGVHYPSDNISSWITALLLCQQVCPDERGAQWLWEAVTTHSRVYKTVAGAAETADSPYVLPMKVLSFVAEAPRTVAETLAFALAQPQLDRAA